MSDNYIGNGKEILLLPNNLREDLVPGSIDGPSLVESAISGSPAGDGTKQFVLDTEVPGGVEHQIRVIRRKFQVNELIESTTEVDIDSVSNKIISTDQNVFSLLSQLKIGQSIIVSGSSDSNNNKLFLISDIDSDHTTNTIEISVDGSFSSSTTGETLKIFQAFDNQFEILEPENSYSLELDIENKYKILTLTEGLYEEDVAYVLHLSSATYSFIPSVGTVGPDQLQQNLRNFTIDRFDAVSDDTFAISQNSVSSSALEIYVDGTWTEGRNEGETIPSSEWELNSSGDTVTFDSPITGRVIIKHLGFSTVSRRASLSQGQVGAPPNNSVDTPQIVNGSITEDKLGNNSVSNSKLKANSVSGSKILLNNNEFLRAKDSISAEKNILKLNSTDQVELNSPNDLLLTVSGTTKVKVTNSTVEPDLDDSIDLGSDSKRFLNSYFKNIDVETSAHVSGDITVDGSVDGVDIAALYSLVQDLKSQVEQPGVIKMWSSDTTLPSGWIVCDGSEHLIATYPNLHSVIGDSFNTTGDGATTFNVPDFRGRFPLGKSNSGTGSGWGHAAGRGGSLDHTHTLPSHQHDITHTHDVPGHYHEHNTGQGSSLNITSSGSHSHTANHSHTASSGSANANITINGSGTLTAKSAGSHNHSITHGVHHTSVGSNNACFRTGGSPITGPVNYTTNTAGSHTHPIDSHGHSITQSGHSHTVTVNTANVTTSPNSHTHSASNFSGSLGNVNGGINGNSNITTTAQSTSLSGSGGSGSSGASNPAYQTIKFIIKY